MQKIQQLYTFMQIFMILFQHKERGVNMHKELYNMEQNDLLAAIYYYYSQDELPQKVQGTIDVTIRELQEGESDPNYIETRTGWFFRQYRRIISSTTYSSFCRFFSTLSISISNFCHFDFWIFCLNP